jgi:uncharacterized protein (TIGR04222 family)
MNGSHTWGISNASFLWFYGIACLLTLGGIWRRRRSLLNAGDCSARPERLDAYDLAMLNGGPQLVITIAAAKLHRIGSLAHGTSGRAVEVRQRPGDADDRAAALEREVYEAVLRNPGVCARSLRKELEACAPIQQLACALTQSGLLLDERTRARINRLWLWILPVPALGIARVVQGSANDAAVASTDVMLAALALATLWLAVQRRWATARGRRLLDTERGGRTTLGRVPSQEELPRALALYGAGALWAADPGIAFAWAVPRERGSTWTGGGDGGGASTATSSPGYRR